MKNCFSKLVLWMNQQKKVIYRLFCLSDEGSLNNKKKRSLWKRVQKPFNRFHLLLITANFPLGPGERASLCCCPLICLLHISVAPSVSGSRLVLAGTCWEAGLLGPPLFWPGRKVRREYGKPKSGNIKKEKKKTSATASVKWNPFTSKNIRNRPHSEAVISNLETFPPQDILFQFSQQL